MRTANTTEKADHAPAEAGAQPFEIVIVNRRNNVLIRWTCPLCCGYETDKQERHYELLDYSPERDECQSQIICDRCGEDPDSIPRALAFHAKSLRLKADALDEMARFRYVRNAALNF